MPAARDSAGTPLPAAPRTWLFVPADDPRKLDSALRSTAAVVVADLEDAVAPAGKELALRAACEFMRCAADGRRVVRINDPAGELGRRDLDALAATVDVPALMVPKATRASVAQSVAAGVRPIALLESARGILELEAIAALEGVLALALGAVDLRAELGLASSAEELELLYARSRLVLAAAAAGLPAIDAVQLDLDDDAGLARAAGRARALGFAGMLCVHPRQLATVDGAFAPSAEELEHARRVLAAYERALREDRGATTQDGEMVDLATVRRARALLGESGLASG